MCAGAVNSLVENMPTITNTNKGIMQQPKDLFSYFALNVTGSLHGSVSYVTEHQLGKMWAVDLSHMNQDPTSRTMWLYVILKIKIVIFHLVTSPEFHMCKVWANRTRQIISFIFAPSHFSQPHISCSPAASIMNLCTLCTADDLSEQSFEGQQGALIAFFVLYFCCSGEMLSLEDGTSSSGGQDAERTKREGPSEYEITLENKNKQVCFVC